MLQQAVKYGRAQAQSIKNNEFILAERSMGAGVPRILIVHMLPNIIGPLLIIASMDIPAVVTIEAGLSFLGVGIYLFYPAWKEIPPGTQASMFNFMETRKIHFQRFLNSWVTVSFFVPNFTANLA